MTPALSTYLDAVQARCDRTEASESRRLRYILFWMGLKQMGDPEDGAHGLMEIVDGDSRCFECPTLIHLVRELAGGLSWVSEHRCIDHEPTRTCVENILDAAHAALARADALTALVDAPLMKRPWREEPCHCDDCEEHGAPCRRHTPETP